MVHNVILQDKKTYCSSHSFRLLSFHSEVGKAGDEVSIDSIETIVLEHRGIRTRLADA